MPFSDPELEKLYAYGRLLQPKLRADDSAARFQIQDEVALEYYRLQKVSEGTIVLESGNEAALRVPGDNAAHANTIDEAPLSFIIDTLNERFGTAFTRTDQLFIDQIAEDLTNDTHLAQHAQINSIDNFKFPFRDQFDAAFIARMDQNQEMTDRVMSEDRFRDVVFDELLRTVYARLRSL